MPDTSLRSNESPRYGFDAPSIMLVLLAIGFTGILSGVGLLSFVLGWARWTVLGAIAISSVPALLGLIMVVYGIAGKPRMRDLMISTIPWRGNEQVLDIGTGLGLLLIAAAKKLNRCGKAVGIDIWRGEDLSGNSLDQLAINIDLEGVEDRVSVKTEDARKLSFPDASFDVVLSLYCIHNIEDRAEQKVALREIARVLKPGGRVLIGDYLPTHSYADAFREFGLTVEYSRTFFLTAFGPMWMVKAEKPGK
jgi:SAM-dependent methyltransferase